MTTVVEKPAAVFRVLRGHPSAEELAALTTVLLLLADRTRWTPTRPPHHPRTVPRVPGTTPTRGLPRPTRMGRLLVP